MVHDTLLMHPAKPTITPPHLFVFMNLLQPQRQQTMTILTQQILDNVQDLPPEMQQEALNFIQFLKSKLAHTETTQAVKETNGKQVVEIMTKMAERGSAFRDIKDPVAWQQEIRKDRVLPGRES